jgi:RNA-directed DNA polymerase
MAEMFDKITEIKSLYNAWRKVRSNKGSAGIDQISWFGFEQKLDANLAELSRNLQTLTYQPLPAKFVQIAKANGKTRELGILAIRDRVAQRAVLDQIEPIFEAEMSDCNYAFRQGRNCEMAIQRILLNRANGDIWTVESDIQNYFGEIDIRILLNGLSSKINDDRVLRLIELWLEAGILRETDAEAEKTWWQLTEENLLEVQAVLGETSYETEYLQFNPEVQELLSNPNADDVSDKIREEMKQAKSSVKREALKKLLESGLLYALSNRAMLARFVGMKALGIGGLVLAGGMFAPKVYELAKDYLRIRKGILQGSPISPLLANIYLNSFDNLLTNRGLRLVRYCDDFVITCKNQVEAENALAIASRELGKVKLSLHPDKTRIIKPDEMFEFLGYRFVENGAVYPPKTLHEKYARQIRDLALKAKSSVKNNAEKVKETYSGIEKLRSLSSLLNILNRKK